MSKLTTIAKTKDEVIQRKNGCQRYEFEKKRIQKMNLSPSGYEKAIREMCKRNGF